MLKLIDREETTELFIVEGASHIDLFHLKKPRALLVVMFWRLCLNFVLTFSIHYVITFLHLMSVYLFIAPFRGFSKPPSKKVWFLHDKDELIPLESKGILFFSYEWWKKRKMYFIIGISISLITIVFVCL